MPAPGLSWSGWRGAESRIKSPAGRRPRPHGDLKTTRLTLDGVPRRRLASPFRLVADPLLAALTRDFDPARGLAPNARGLRLRAQPHAADGAVHAHALVLAAGREALAVAVDDAVVLAARPRHI